MKRVVKKVFSDVHLFNRKGLEGKETQGYKTKGGGRLNNVTSVRESITPTNMCIYKKVD